MTAIQSRINSGLAAEIGDGYVAAVISFGSGLIVLLVILAFSPRGRRGVGRVVRSVRTRVIPWWYLLGGMAGALFVLSQGLTGAILGVAMFTVAVVCGQTISGLVVDNVGLGTMAPVPITVTRLIGSVLALGAVAWAVSAQIGSSAPAWALILPFAAGIGLGWQQAANGQVRVAADSALTASVGNFVTGTTVLVTACAIHLAFVGLPDALPTDPRLYLGGVIGASFIGLAIIIVKRTGALLLGLGLIAGQIMMSVVIDIALPVAGREVAASTIAGAALTLVAVAIATVPSRPIGLGRAG